MEREKLTREHLALKVHNLRIKHGNVVRLCTAEFTARVQDTCIDCGWTIQIGDVIQSAIWQYRNVQGFYAHVECQPISDSAWLSNVDFADVFSRGDYAKQKCTKHYIQVTARILVGDHAIYVCSKCVKEPQIK